MNESCAATCTAFLSFTTSAPFYSMGVTPNSTKEDIPGAPLHGPACLTEPNCAGLFIIFSRLLITNANCDANLGLCAGVFLCPSLTQYPKKGPLLTRLLAKMTRFLAKTAQI
jgi:hypothetical protein